ncbi:conserved exported hypothetical protein [Sphingomonas sp. EC-HK361]|jgi:hypothetical protein|nr:conserved exported hypothetical protein [Sphingomonas sp. EC-HK361]
MVSRGFLAKIARLGAGFGAVAVLAPAAADAPLRYPPATIVMFVAGWCAPCHGEIARLDDITAAARPFAVGVTVLDESAAGRAMMRAVPRDQLLMFPPEKRRQIEARLFRDSAGLPYSIAIDESGRVCADRRDGLDAAKARAMVAACRNGRTSPP